MSRRRLDKLEGSLSPKEAVKHWLGEAHAYGSLPAYAESLIDQPESKQPFVSLPRRVADAVWTSMRREPRAAVEKASREAVADTVFLVGLVLGLNAHLEQVLRVESLRHASLYWWSRALDPERRGKTERPPAWLASAAMLVVTVMGSEAALRAAETRYLDGHDCLFPDLGAEWHELLAAADALTADTPDVADTSAREQAAEGVRQVVHMARADGLDASGRLRAADDVAARVARLMVDAGPCG